MFDFGTSTLFWIILTVLALITICLFLIAYVIVKGEKERERDRQFARNIAEAEKEMGHECHHFLGYLAEQPRHQPIPEECFGCTVAMDCIRATKSTDKIADKNMTEAEQAIRQ